MLIDYIIKWQTLGVKTQILNCFSKVGSIKSFDDRMDVYPEDPINPKWQFYNFLAIDLGYSGISCLDIDGGERSVNEFKERLEKINISLDSLFYETTINSGLHIYFRRKKEGAISNFKGLSDGLIVFDILNTGRSFTAPSKFKNNGYEWGKNNPFTIESTYDIPEVPEWLNEIFYNVTPISGKRKQKSFRI